MPKEAWCIKRGFVLPPELAGVAADWRERVRIGSDRKMSSTARENLTTRDEVPDELPETQKQLVDYYVPGLRALLGYA